ncbi:FecR family protein [Cellvibrio sp. NN19]|uniref:FecR family protein n=1 Tax=Cellvibrio chitinivorans TaxID=3102792 RepID=UPI002B409235|nr:FecR domain-containing protein [Cellvibrio sp. NN19]
MSNVYPFQTENQIYEEASLWVTRLERGLNDAETEALRQWLSLSPKHKDCLMEMANLWDRMDRLSVLSELFDRPAAQTAGAQTTGAQTTGAQSSSAKHHSARTWAIAASVSVFAIALGLWLPSIQTQTPSSSTPIAQAINSEPSDSLETSNTLYETGVGAHSTVNLPDGTKMLLNTSTQVSVTYSEHERLLVLKKGELMVEVAHDKTRPLRVQIGEKFVEAVGTAFNVYRKDDQNFDVIVTEGRVQVKPVALKFSDTTTDPTRSDLKSAAIQELSRGEKLTVRASLPSAIETIASAIIQDHLSWRDGNVVFRGETLQDALDELSRYTSDDFKVVDSRINDIRIAGLYKAGDTEGLLLALKENFNIASQRNAEGVFELSLQTPQQQSQQQSLRQ